MRRGCISLGNIGCDGCHLSIPHSERYLIIEEKDGVTLSLCVKCCLEKGYARYREDRREQVLTFFAEPVQSPPDTGL
jgi:sulfur relay (sulfurtransferase) complex TusBCD TusD component (DsrE family)